MPLHSLDHANIRTTNLAVMIAFYEDVLNMTNGPRADFDFPGAWLYLGDTAVVHLVSVQGNPQTKGDLALEHAAFRATDLKAFIAKLTEHNVEYYFGFPPGFPIVQVNLQDPDGNHLHVDFHIDEMEAAGITR
ncbi:MAG: glyoxalase [Shimia sp.]|nr:glyoxalase [Shimia sp.]